MKDIVFNIINFKYKKLIFPIIVILIYVVGIVYLFYIYGEIKGTKINNNEIIATSDMLSIVATSEEVKIDNKIHVDVKGSVNKPGVYEVDSGSRVIDVINISGGLKKDANTRFINLSKVLNDGDVIVIYSNSEIEKASKEEKIIVETPCVCEKIKNDVCITDNIEEDNEETNENDNKNIININSATIDELMLLDGIGEVKASAIIVYRNNNGPFKTIDDLANVDGISETTISKIKDNITV